MKIIKGGKKDQQDIEELVKQIVDYAEFMEPVEEELSEEELDQVVAARAETPYRRFLERMKKEGSV